MLYPGRRNGQDSTHISWQDRGWEEDDDQTSESSYYAVAKVSDRRDGTIEGVFVFPIGSEHMLDDPLTKHFERGIYYLGRNFVDIKERSQWQLIEALKDTNLEIYPGMLLGWSWRRLITQCPISHDFQLDTQQVTMQHNHR